MINTLHLGLSYNCNMRCSHCFVDKMNDKLDINCLKKSIDYLDEQGLFFLIYTFGEPILAKEFFNVAKYVSKKNIIQTLMTNGSLINEKNIVNLKDCKVNNIYISFDSIVPEKHDLNRNYKGSYNKSIESLKLLQKADFNVGIAVTINDSNIRELRKFVDLAKLYKIKNISFLRQRDNGNLIHLKDNKIYLEFYEEYLKNYQNYNINILFHDIELLNKTKELYDINKINKNLFEKYIDMNSCHYKTTLSIQPNGDVSYCNLINKNIGNINNRTIEEILSNGGKKDECVICRSKFSK